MIRLLGRNIGLRWGLFGLSLAAMIPIMLFAAYTIVEVHQQQREHILDDFQRKSVALGGKVEARVNLAVHLLEGLAASSAAQRSDWSTLYESAQRVVAQNAHFRAITLVNDKEEVLFLTTLPYGAITFSSNFNHLIRESLETGRPNASGPFVTKVSPDKLVAVTVPIQHGKERKFALRMIVTSTSISELLGKDAIEAGWIAGVVDRNGIVLARSKDADSYVGKRAGQLFIAALQRGERGLFQSVTLEGISVTNSIEPIHGRDWFLGVGVPNEILDAPLRKQLLRLIAVALGCVLFALVLSQWIAKRIATQIRQS